MNKDLSKFIIKKLKEESTCDIKDVNYIKDAQPMEKLIPETPLFCDNIVL